ncbi:glycoside hydrolase family 18 protein [Aspergillus terreus]|uniref:Glycoside hydrolase family 18 protein n=1 Tax=Aspergillus terreus TaxID=33178 RepID=A0A5M3Z5C5_ASPTE|nr:hypothetical protein ATETN484_0009011500 [Aspergillus terreus]GFF17566.1 glycoside hydrolase family 18 protein [Aspergillus terreus]
MAQVKEIREDKEEIEEEQRKNLIRTIIGEVFRMVPFISEMGLLAAGAKILARAALITGKAVNGALAMYDLVNADSLLLNLMGMLLGAGGMAVVKRDATNVNKMASLRRHLTEGQKSAVLGDVFKRNDGALQGIFPQNCRR